MTVPFWREITSKTPLDVMDVREIGGRTCKVIALTAWRNEICDYLTGETIDARERKLSIGDAAALGDQTRSKGGTEEACYRCRSRQDGWNFELPVEGAARSVSTYAGVVPPTKYRLRSECRVGAKRHKLSAKMTKRRRIGHLFTLLARA